jgi:hypothetical protein
MQAMIGEWGWFVGSLLPYRGAVEARLSVDSQGFKWRVRSATEQRNPTAANTCFLANQFHKIGLHWNTN